MGRARTLFIVVLALCTSGNILFAKDIDPTTFLAGIWNLQRLVDREKSGELDEVSQPYELSCNGISYHGWSSSVHVEIRDRNPYLAVIDGAFAILQATCINSESFLLKVIYSPADFTVDYTSELTVHVISSDQIWFEPIKNDQRYIDYLLTQGFWFGPGNLLCRAPKWVNP
jgi:hypothetical protein